MFAPIAEAVGTVGAHLRGKSRAVPGRKGALGMANGGPFSIGVAPISLPPQFAMSQQNSGDILQEGPSLQQYLMLPKFLEDGTIMPVGDNKGFCFFLNKVILFGKYGSSSEEAYTILVRLIDGLYKNGYTRLYNSYGVLSDGSPECVVVIKPS